MADEDVHLAVQKRGTIALPPGVRRRHHLDQPGAQVRLVERSDGIIELHPVLAVRSDQAWFWSQRWQTMEAEAEADIKADRMATLEGPEQFLIELDAD